MSAAVARLVEDLRERGGLKGSDLANITSVSQATVSRCASGIASPHPKTQIIISDLRYVVDRLAEFYTPQETRIWLYAKHPLLNGARAIDLIYTGDADRVLGSHRKPIRRDLHVGAPSRPIDPRRAGRDGAGVHLRGRLAGHQQGPRPAPWFSSSGTLDPSGGIRGALYQPPAQRRANRDWLSAFP
jgi:hypothetical protein